MSRGFDELLVAFVGVLVGSIWINLPQASQKRHYINLYKNKTQVLRLSVLRRRGNKPVRLFTDGRSSE